MLLRPIFRCTHSARRLARQNWCARAYSDKPASPHPQAVSSCPANTTLTGLNYLKDQEPVLALPDEDYPPWLWKLLDAKVHVDDGPGGEGEKKRRRQENRQRIREQNFLKTQ